jgi:hypothetical protein
MERLVEIGEAGKVLDVSIATLCQWEAEGRLIPDRTPSGHRRYDLAKLRTETFRAEADAHWLMRAFPITPRRMIWNGGNRFLRFIVPGRAGRPRWWRISVRDE